MANTPTNSRPAKPAAAAVMAMAGADHGDHGHVVSDAPGMDYPAHEKMFNAFGEIVKWGIVAGAVLVIFLFLVIHPMIPTVAS
jgi:hypothetical protein